jgi:hypothetical protein
VGGGGRERREVNDLKSELVSVKKSNVLLRGLGVGSCNSKLSSENADEDT